MITTPREGGVIPADDERAALDNSGLGRLVPDVARGDPAAHRAVLR
ncbi:MAG: hypothetical protein ACRCYR_10570 [Phycicoccus sp.]